MSDIDGIDLFSQLIGNNRDVFQKILSFVPVKDRIRCQRVDKNWKDQCDWSIRHQPGIIDFGDRKFKKMTPTKIEKLLDNCHQNLLGVRLLGSWKKEKGGTRKSNRFDIIKNFKKFSYPKLEFLEVGWKGMGDDEEDEDYNRYCALVVDALECCPAVKIFENRLIDLSKLENADCLANLVSLITQDVEPKMLTWLGVHAKKLKNVDFAVSLEGGPIQEFNWLFRSCKQLQSISLRDAEGVMPPIGPYDDEGGKMCEFLEQVPEFWKLTNITALFRMGRMSKQFVFRAIHSFPNLQKLQMRAGDDIGNECISALAQLANLTSLSITGCGCLSISDGLSAVAVKGKLRKLEVIGCILDDFNCVFRVVQFCPWLQHLVIQNLQNQPSIQNCIILIEQIESYLGKCRELNVSLFHRKPACVTCQECTHWLRNVWDDETVQISAEKLIHMDQNRRVIGEIGKLRLNM